MRRPQKQLSTPIPVTHAQSPFPRTIAARRSLDNMSPVMMPNSCATLWAPAKEALGACRTEVGHHMRHAPRRLMRTVSHNRSRLKASRRWEGTRTDKKPNNSCLSRHLVRVHRATQPFTADKQSGAERCAPISPRSELAADRSFFSLTERGFPMYRTQNVRDSVKWSKSARMRICGAKRGSRGRMRDRMRGMPTEECDTRTRGQGRGTGQGRGRTKSKVGGHAPYCQPPRAQWRYQAAASVGKGERAHDGQSLIHHT